MNDQAKMMSQKPPQIPMMAQQPPPPPQILSQPPLIAQSPALSQSQMMMMKSQPNPQQPLPMLNPNLNRSFNIGNSNKVWSQQQQVSKVNYATAANSLKPSSKLGRSNWKGKNVGGAPSITCRGDEDGEVSLADGQRSIDGSKDPLEFRPGDPRWRPLYHLA